MSLTNKPAGQVSPPNTVNPEAPESIDTPNTLTSEAAGSVSTPNTLTSETAGSVSAPNTINPESAGSVSAPNTLTAEAAGAVAAPNEITGVAAGKIDPPYPPVTLNLDFAKNIYSELGADNVFSDIITFTRSTTSSYFGREVDQFGNVTFPLKTAAIDEPCLAYDPATGASLGLQVFGSATNLLTYSEQFDNANWTKQGATITSNAINAPDGTLSADKLIPDNLQDPDAVDSTQLRQSTSIVSGATYTLSLFAKSGEFSKVKFRDNLSTGGFLVIDLAGGTVLSNNTVGNFFNERVIACQNGWVKISFSYTSATTATTTFYSIRCDDTGDGTSGIYIWGAQLEAGSIATPYIKAEASQVTRAADLVAVGTDLTAESWFNTQQGTFYVGGSINKVGSTSYIIDSRDSGGLNGVTVTDSGGAGVFNLAVRSGSSTPSFDIGSYSVDFALCATYGSVLASGVVNGGGVASASRDFNQTSANGLSVGKTTTSSILMGGHIKTLSYYPTALSTQKLQELTR